jgi:hypothetical protein
MDILNLNAQIAPPDEAARSAAQDRWMESTYNAFNKFLTPEQWEKYLKNGAAREKKARDKRAQKAAKASEKLRK